MFRVLNEGFFRVDMFEVVQRDKPDKILKITRLWSIEFTEDLRMRN